MISFLLTFIGDDPCEQERFRELYYRYRSVMLYRAKKYSGNYEEAFDVLQEAFIRVAKNFDKIGEISSDETKHFLLTVVENQAKTNMRKHQKIKEAEKAYIEGKLKERETESGDTSFSFIELKDILKELPETYKRPLYMYYVQGFRTKEIAQVLGISDASVRKRIERARTMLKELMG